MADLFREVDEALREDRAKTFWKKYGSLVIAVAVALVLGTAAFVLWENYKARQNQSQNAQFAEALGLADESPEQAAEALAAFAANGADQATLARFYEAGIRAESGNSAAAADLYRQISADEQVDRVWRDLGLLLAVLHGLDEGDPAALQADLEPLAAEDSPWRFSARELSGVIALREGDRDRARSLFAELAEAQDAPAGVRSRAVELVALLTEQDDQ